MPRLGRLLGAISLPRLAEHRLRTALTVVGVALGVALLVAVLLVNQSVMRGVAATIDDISGRADLEVSAGSSGIDDALVDVVRDTPGVAKLGVTLQQVASLRDARLPGARVLVVGTDFLSEDDAHFRAYASDNLEAIKRDPVAFLNTPDNLLLGRRLADRLGLHVGDAISLATGTGVRRFTVRGLLEPGGVGDGFDGAIAVMDYQAMQLAFARGRSVDRIEIALAPGADAAKVGATLHARLGGAFVVAPPSHKGARIGRMLLGVRTALSMASVIALLVGAFLIHGTMAISVVQRKRDLGTLRALGSRRGDVRALLTLEGALFGAVGSLLGVVLGVGLARGLLGLTSRVLNATYLQLSAAEVAPSPQVILGALLVGVATSTVAAALAATHAGSLRPVEALRTAGIVALARDASLCARDVAAAALAVASFAVLYLPSVGPLPLPAFAAMGLLLGVGVLLMPRAVALQHALIARLAGARALTLRLASANLARDVGRTSRTASGLMVGVAMATAFAMFIASFTAAIEDWVAQTMPGDLFVTNAASIPGASSRNVPMADVLSAPLRALPAIADVRRIHITELPYAGVFVKLVSTDVDVLARRARVRPLEGSVSDALAGMRRGEVAVSENFARRFAVHRGDRIVLGTHGGSQPFTVAAVLVDYTSDLGTILMDRAAYVRAFADARVSTYELHLARGADAEAVREAILRAHGAAHDLFVLTHGQVRREVEQRTTEVFGLLQALELVALVVAVLGIVNALLASVLDRTRELGVLRALGMLRRELAQLVLTEGALLAALGTLGGLAVGFGLGRVLLDHVNVVSTGWHFPLRFAPAALLEIVAITLVAAMLAAYHPARQTARMSVTDALGHE